MITAFVIVLAAAALLFVLKPLFSSKFIRMDMTDARTRELEQLVKRKNKVYSDIKDLDFEFGIGKMAENDYQSLRKECIHEVADILRLIDSHEKLSDGNGKITNAYLEQIIASKRKVKPDEILMQTHPEILACASCGFENNLRAKFCTECGTKLTQEP